MRPVSITLTPIAASATAVTTAQAKAAAGDLTINGTKASGGVATMDIQRRVLLTFSANESATGLIVTVYGTNGEGITISEAIGGAAATAISTLDFFTVTRVALNQATTTGGAATVSVGTSAATTSCSSKWIPLDQHVSPFNVSVSTLVTGTINFTTEYTEQDMFPVNATVANGGVAFTAKTLDAAGAISTYSSIIAPVSAVRITINSYTNPGTVQFIVRQAGLFG